MRSLRRFSWAKNAFGIFPLFLPLAITAFGGPERSFSLAIIALGALELIFSKYSCGLGKKTEEEESRLAIPPRLPEEPKPSAVRKVKQESLLPFSRPETE